MLLVVVVLGLAMSVPAGVAGGGIEGGGTGGASAASGSRSWSAPSAAAQPAPADRGPANLRHGPPGQPLAETARAFGSSTLAAGTTDGATGPLFPGRAWITRSSGAVRQVLDVIAPRLGRAPPSSRVS
jgi:hypothetical protein